MQSFRFACQPGCIRCCESPGVVRLAPGDAQRMAHHLGVDLQTFHSSYVMQAADGLFLQPSPSNRCPFLLPSGCAVHEAKPTQCRLYPFWPEIVETRQSWQRTVELCPGIGKGPLIQIAGAVSRAQEMKRAFPKSYEP
ncbi:MAG: YkgJ family cysteine cluster protein [Bryobacterales bacterium]|nr:YkgJ family cysteine cluster protein [Bryobacterales bacterium]